MTRKAFYDNAGVYLGHATIKDNCELTPEEEDAIVKLLIATNKYYEDKEIN